jgi:urease accessory protein
MLGDRHVPAQVFANRLRIRRNPEIEALLTERGARTAAIEAPFEPDAAAPARDHHDHRHHGHNRDHHHGQDDHHHGGSHHDGEAHHHDHDQDKR